MEGSIEKQSNSTATETVVVGLVLDAGGRRRDAFWFYVGGYFTVGAALVYYVLNGYGNDGGSSGAWLALVLVGSIVLLGSAVLRRATWATYGALGVYAALSYYSRRTTGRATCCWRSRSPSSRSGPGSSLAGGRPSPSGS